MTRQGAVRHMTRPGLRTILPGLPRTVLVPRSRRGLRGTALSGDRRASLVGAPPGST